MPDRYELVPTTRQRSPWHPPGWIQLAPNMNPRRKTMAEGDLNQKMPRRNTVAMNQNCVSKVLSNSELQGRTERPSSPTS